jgi:hypothetical protein
MWPVAGERLTPSLPPCQKKSFADDQFIFVFLMQRKNKADKKSRSNVVAGLPAPRVGQF